MFVDLLITVAVAAVVGIFLCILPSATHKWFITPLWKRRLAKIAPALPTIGTPFPFLRGYQACLVEESDYFLRRQRNPGRRALILRISGDEEMSAFAFDATNERPRERRDDLENEHGIRDLKCTFWGNEPAAYHFLDPPTRAFLDRHEFLISGKNLTLVLVDSELDGLAALSRLPDEWPILQHQVRALLVRLLNADTLKGFPKRLAPFEPVGFRRRALEAWLLRPKSSNDPVFPQTDKQGDSSLEYLWFQLDQGASLDKAMLDRLNQVRKLVDKIETYDAFEKPLRWLLERHTPERRITILQPLLQVNQGRQAVISVMAAYPAPAYNPDLITLFRDNPTDPAPLTALCVKDQADIIDFLIEVLSDAPKLAQRAAAAQLGVHGNQAAMIALNRLRREKKGRTRAACDAAFLSLREKLGIPDERGALSPVQPDEHNGALSPVALNGGTLEPSEKPRLPTDTPHRPSADA